MSTKRPISRVSKVSVDRTVISRFGLLEFAIRAWSLVEPRPFQFNWHHRVICDALERVARGELQKLVIMVPPGSTKTLFTGIFFPAWRWIQNPERKFIYSTYGGSLTLKAARQMRDLVMSEWYRARWKARIPFQNTHAAAFFENNFKGFRFSGSTGGEVTGRHGDDLIGDDLNKAQDALGGAAESMTRLDESWDFWSKVLVSRRADPVSTSRVLVGQRLHELDVPGRWIASDPKVHIICLPMRYDPDHPFVSPEDPRKERGELFWPERFPEEVVRELEVSLGPIMAAAQLQQLPVSLGGKLIEDAWLEHRFRRLPAELERTMESGEIPEDQRWAFFWDMNFKGKEAHSQVAGVLAVCKGADVYFVDAVAESTGFNGALRMIRDMNSKYPWVGDHRLEDAANAPACQEQLEHEIPGVNLEPVAGGTLARTQASLGYWQAGNVWLPAQADWLGGGEGFVAQHVHFDGMKKRLDDYVSCSSLALRRFLAGSDDEPDWMKAMKKIKAKRGEQ